MKILLTGSNGFIGKNLTLWLKNHNHEVLGVDIDNADQLENYLIECDYIVHLAGVNRPLNQEEFYDGNTNLTKHLVDLLKKHHKDVPLIYSSSIQADLDNDYGKSKKLAEDYLLSSGLRTYVYRLKNVFGKWCRPNYNSVVATFCYNVAHDLPLTIRDESYVVTFNYIDDICRSWLNVIEDKNNSGSKDILYVEPSYECSLGDIAKLLYKFKNNRKSLLAPSSLNEFEKKLYATYLSYLDTKDFKYQLDMHVDNRGSFTEFIKTENEGQVSINIAKPGIVKGNHYHHTKNEKFLVVKGTCSIKFRKVDSDEIIEYIVSGDNLEVVDIPTGYTHSITNIGTEDSVTVMWANEPFDKDNPDTYFLEVIQNAKKEN